MTYVPRYSIPGPNSQAARALNGQLLTVGLNDETSAFVSPKGAGAMETTETDRNQNAQASNCTL